MRLPGTGIRRLLARWCGTRTLSRVVEPVLADVQAEYQEAVGQGRHWRGRWIRIAGVVSLARAMACDRALAIFGQHRQDEVHQGPGRAGALAVFFVSFAVMVAFEVAPFMDSAAAWNPGYSRTALLYLIPAALPIAIPFGLTLSLIRWLGQAPRGEWRRVMAFAFVVSVGSFLLLGWVVPETNQSFRVTLAGTGVARGLNELTLGDLMARAGDVTSVGGRDTATYVFHRRLALSAAPVVLSLFVIALTARSPRGRVVRWVAAGAGLVGYATLMNVPAAAAAPVAAAWCANVIFVVLSVLLWQGRPVS